MKKFLVAGLLLCGVSSCNSAPRKKLSETFVNTAVSLDGKIFCGEHKDWFITTISGPCHTFTEPVEIAVGGNFSANGRIRTIRFILASQADEDITDDRSSIKKGEWSCTLAESINDLDLEGDGDKLWLYIADCQPGRPLPSGS